MTLARDQVIDQLKERLASLESNCLKGLEEGLDAVVGGDLTHSAVPVTKPIDADTSDPDLREIAETFNRMLGRAQAALYSYNRMREQLRSALGDKSVVDDLCSRMRSLHDNCLTDLNGGLHAMHDGDLTIEVIPLTTPIERPAGQSLGEFGELFNSMLAKAQSSLEAYNATRETFRGALGDQSILGDLRERMQSLHDHCLTNLGGGLESMSQGDLTIDVRPVTNPIERPGGQSLGEFGELFNSMLTKAQGGLYSYNNARERVCGMIREIQQSSVTVASASTQMASTSEEAGRAVGEIAHAVGDVAQGAERQVRSVEDAKAMAEEVASASQLSAENAQETASAAEEARTFAEEGASAVDQATGAMQAVRESSAEVTEAIRSLGDKSAHIGGIVATITGIAQQTNLLALNAAIEAARAGEQGRGFAVVAEEVRKLAEESQQAAANIASLIQEIQKETSRAVEVVETGARRTEEGAATVEQARASFLKIGGSVQDMTARVDQIAAAVQQIAVSSQRMQDSMNDVAALAQQSSAATEEVSASTEETSASTQEIAASAQQLAMTAEELERLVGQFTIV
jgi:methyl-accepting chemotaxis protein